MHGYFLLCLTDCLIETCMLLAEVWVHEHVVTPIVATRVGEWAKH